MKSSDSNAAKHSQPKNATKAPGEGVASEPTIIAEQQHKTNKGPHSVKADKASKTSAAERK